MNYSIHNQRIKIRMFFWLLVAIIGFPACSSPVSERAEKAASETAAGEDFILTISQFSASEMELARIENHDFFQTIKTNGIFDIPPRSKAAVSAYFGGYVVNNSLLPGEKVKKGQILFVLENPDYLKFQQEYLEAKNKLDFMLSNYERQKTLVQDSVTSEKNYLKAKADYTSARIRYKVLRKKIFLMHIDPDSLSIDNISSIIAVPAPISGYVDIINISNGVFLQPEDVAVTIINTDHLHLELNIFENDLAYIRVGQPIRFTIQDGGDREFNAFVYQINKSIDPESRMIRVHGHLRDENEKNLFTPGMYVEARIYTSSASYPALPADAVVQLENRQYVLVLISSDENSFTFSKREVKTGRASGAYVQILNYSDFEPDAEFLSKGAFNLIRE